MKISISMMALAMLTSACRDSTADMPDARDVDAPPPPDASIVSGRWSALVTTGDSYAVTTSAAQRGTWQITMQEDCRALLTIAYDAGGTNYLQFRFTGPPQKTWLSYTGGSSSFAKIDSLVSPSNLCANADGPAQNYCSSDELATSLAGLWRQCEGTTPFGSGTAGVQFERN